MVAFFKWRNEYQKRTEETYISPSSNKLITDRIVPTRLKSGVVQINYDIVGDDTQLDIQISRATEEGLNKSVSDIKKHIRQQFPDIRYDFDGSSHTDTVVISIQDMTQQEVREMLLFLHQKAWINYSVVEDMNKDFAKHNRRIDRNTGGERGR